MDREMFLKYLITRNKHATLENTVGRKSAIPKNMTLEYKHNLTPSQSNLMTKLFFEGAQQVKEIAEYLSTKSTNATRLVNSLIQRGYCKKQKEHGKKAVFVDLTSEGRAIVNEEVEATIKPDVDRFNKYMSLTEQEELIWHYERLIDLLSRFS